ncbi:hypothetical protein FMM80_24340 [Schaedlerella arabinosiphila]|uniref:Uncharacterized protein n=1 Tax=Schaedlerella arabinosiphila TaxID=2044587 RepID=A0A9X5CCA2_9FIRM|nr:hypothetical protein [Schaedlerella arabinosiphila]KAI4444749.1 hypothetical protein C824_000036 [Schaedlerella arabinosiphila]NDO71608.1 hypothetical protein [Schaedlerella arabinosiphila]
MDRYIKVHSAAQIGLKNKVITSIRPLYAIIIFGGLIGSLFSAVIIVKTDRAGEYFLYFLLPLGFAIFLICTLFCNSKIQNKNVFIIFVGLYFIKLVITPAVSAMSGWYALAKGEGYLDYLSEAILLTVWEPVFIGALLMIYTNSREYRIKSNFLKEYGIKFDGADLLIIIATLFVVGTLLYYPPLRVRVAWLLTIETNEAVTPVVRSWRDFFTANGRQLPLGIIDTLMMKTFYIIRVLFPLMLIEKIYHQNWRWRKKAFLSLFIVLLCAQVTTEANGETILMAIGLILLLFMIYPKLYESCGKAIIMFGVVVAGMLFALKVKGSSGDTQSDVTFIQSISATMNAYMNGPVNLAIAIKAKENYNMFMGIEEILGGLPILNRFFSGYQTSTIFNEAFWGMKGRTDQLLPALGQGYMYFGSVFAPIVQFFFIIWGLGLEDLSEKAESIKVKGYFIFMAVLVIWTIGNNLSHVMSFFIRYFPGIIILYFKKYRVKVKS